MRFGKISAILLGPTCALLILLPKPFRGDNPVAALGEAYIICLCLAALLAALIVGIVGIIRDERKILAIITTIIAGGFMLFVMCR